MASYGKENKKDIINKYKLSDTDTGSIELQISLLTHRINHLVSHLKIHHKDNHTRVGLLSLVGKRKCFISYLRSKKPEALEKLAKELKIKVKVNS